MYTRQRGRGRVKGAPDAHDVIGAGKDDAQGTMTDQNQASTADPGVVVVVVVV